MGLLEDTVKLLERIPGWKKISESPERIDALEKRIEHLEKLLSGSGELCPKCKKPTFELISSRSHPVLGSFGAQLNLYRCSRCNHQQEKMTE